MVNIFDYLQLSIDNILANKLYLCMTLLLVLLFLSISYYIFNIFVKNNLSLNHVLIKEYISETAQTGDDVLIIYFYTEWCPYCKKANPEWEKFSEHIKNINKTNDYEVKLLKIDCDKHEKTAEKYKIEGYPTIKLLYKGTEYEYDAKVNKEHLIKFLETSINK